MSRFHVAFAAALLAIVPLAAAQDTQQITGPEPVATAEPRVAIPRSEAPARPPAAEPAAAERPARSSPAQAGGASGRTTVNADDQRRAEPRGSRPRGDNPRTGEAVPRTSRRLPPPSGRDPVYRPAPRVYNDYYYTPRYYYPRRSYPYGYGAFGLGYFYYNPYGWSSHSYYGPGAYRSDYHYGGRRFRGYGYGYPVGELRLRVNGPRDAHVLVDGYYAGIVDDFDGIVQSLRLEEGPYQIEIVAPGYETLAFDVRIMPGEKITYRGSMRRVP